MIAASDAEERARREWRAALDRYASHTETCDAYTANLPCGGCGALLKREQDAWKQYHASKGGRR